MAATLRTLILMLLVPPLLLLGWAHLLRPLWSGSEFVAVAVAGLLGLAGVATSPWPDRIKAVVAPAYVLLALIALPFLTLLAVCSTGDCL